MIEVFKQFDKYIIEGTLIYYMEENEVNSFTMYERVLVREDKATGFKQYTRNDDNIVIIEYQVWDIDEVCRVDFAAGDKYTNQKSLTYKYDVGNKMMVVNIGSLDNCITEDLFNYISSNFDKINKWLYSCYKPLKETDKV